MAPIDKVSVEAVPELDTGRAADDGVRTAVPTGAVVCRYCRNVQAEGMVCDAAACACRGCVPPRPAATAKGGVAAGGV